MGPRTVLEMLGNPWFSSVFSGLACGACGLAPELGLRPQLPPIPGHSNGFKDRQWDPARTGTDQGMLVRATEAAWLRTLSFLS